MIVSKSHGIWALNFPRSLEIIIILNILYLSKKKKKKYSFSTSWKR